MKTVMELLNEYHDMPFKVPMPDMGDFIQAIQRDTWGSATKAQNQHLFDSGYLMSHEVSKLAPFPGEHNT